MVDCYRVSDFKVESGDSGLRVAVQTTTLGPRETNIHAVLSTAGTIVVELLSPVAPWSERGEVFTLTGASVADVQELLRAHTAPTVTVMTEADLSVCLGFYSDPPTETHSRKQTPTGELLNRAKYKDSKSAADRLIRSAVAYVRKHPVLRRAERVVALPSSTAAGPARRNTLPRKLVSALEETFGMQDAQLERVTPRDTKQKNLPDGADRTAHQRGTMAVREPGPGSVLIVDDVMGYGDSMNEAVRAVREAGFEKVFSLCLAKNLTGTTGYDFDAE